MARQLKIKKEEKQYIQKKLGNMVDFKEVANLSIAGISSHMKQAALGLMPDVFRAMVFMALGETEFECEHCGEDNKVVTGDGDFRAIKYLLEQGMEWVPIIKTMNFSIGVDVQIPQEVLQAPSQRDVDKEVMREWINMGGISREDLLTLYDEVMGEDLKILKPTEGEDAV